MKKSFFQFLILLLLFFGLPSLLPAQSGYVSDMLFLTFREGPGNSYAILKRLKSDTPVSILEEKGEYYKVELESKETGWVDKRFISFETPKIMTIEALKQENKTLEDKILELETRLQSVPNSSSIGGNESGKKIKELEEPLKPRMDETEKMGTSLPNANEKALIEQSEKFQQIVNENKALQKKNEALAAELADLQSKGPRPLKSDMIKWSLFGVGVLLLGWLFGHTVSINKRRGGSSLLS
jgi:SH3 domain protein